MRPVTVLTFLFVHSCSHVRIRQLWYMFTTLVKYEYTSNIRYMKGRVMQIILLNVRSARILATLPLIFVYRMCGRFIDKNLIIYYILQSFWLCSIAFWGGFFTTNSTVHNVFNYNCVTRQTQHKREWNSISRTCGKQLQLFSIHGKQKSLQISIVIFNMIHTLWYYTKH